MPCIERHAIADHAMLVRVQPGEQSRAGRPARIGLGVMPRETGGFPHQRVEMRRAGKGMAGRSQQIAAPLIGGDQKDVGAGGSVGHDNLMLGGAVILTDRAYWIFRE